MMWAFIIGGFSLGLAGSLHCVGMCGPLALALPVYHLTGVKKFISLLLYQVGRITTYATLGLLFGLVGRRLYIAGIQQWLSLLLGISILLSAPFYFHGKRTLHMNFLNRFYFSVQKTIGNLLRTGKGFTSFFLMGMANGLLPCGMVYIAIAGALSTIDVTSSVLFMAFFGAGTLPAMMMISYFGKMIPLSARSSMKKAVPYFIAVMGVLLILRGLNLDIPFISPAMPAVPGEVVSCHF
jgi:sulfite exporter TauE/SafE